MSWFELTGLNIAIAVAHLWLWRRARHKLVARSEAARRHALELSDDIVQGLTVAQLALDLSDGERSAEAVDRSLRTARQVITELLERAHEADVVPGDLRRSTPAKIH